jgi:carbonic anhydrase/acetyltransferase-like protein (isoleucine patch superfamily)
MVMGSPAKVKRALSDEEVRFLLESADSYVRYRLDYQR